MAESSTDEELSHYTATGSGEEDGTEEGAVVIEYIELRYESGDPTNYRESLI